MQTPTGSIGEVKVHTVELKHRHSVDLLKQIFLREEVSRHVEVQSAVRETRFVGDGAAVDGAQGALLGHLKQSLHSIECASLGGSAYDYALGCDGEGVALGRSRLFALFADNDGYVRLRAAFLGRGLQC